jgi:hypothetical protein
MSNTKYSNNNSQNLLEASVLKSIKDQLFSNSEVANNQIQKKKFKPLVAANLKNKDAKTVYNSAESSRSSPTYPSSGCRATPAQNPIESFFASHSRTINSQMTKVSSKVP